MTKGKVLVVEDDEDLARMLTYNLHKKGYLTAEALDGDSACKQCKTRAPESLKTTGTAFLIDSTGGKTSGTPQKEWALAFTFQRHSLG